MRKSNFLVIIPLLFCSCNKTFDNSVEMQKYIADEQNGYQYLKNINGVDYKLQYRPTDMMVQQELGDSSTSPNIEKLRSQYSKFMYFNLYLSQNNQEILNSVSGDKDKFGQMVNGLAFGMGEKIHIYNATKDTLEMTDFIYPRMYGMSQSTTILIVYPRDKNFLKEEYLNFTIEDFGLNTGETRFKINTEAINNEPHLKF